MGPLGEPQKIIVDGYNVIYADDALRRTAIRDMERARREFIERIRIYLVNKQVQITVVFDGKGVIADAEAVVPGQLQLVYSAGHETADDLIISIVAKSGNPTAYLVVTSDKAHIRPAVSALGCRVIGSRRFLERIVDKGARESTERREEKPQPAATDTDYWLDQFEQDAGDDDDA